MRSQKKTSSLFQAGPAVEELPPPPPPPAEPPVESAWERGLRHAKEVHTCAFQMGFSTIQVAGRLAHVGLIEND